MARYRFNPFTKKLDIADQTVGPPGTVTALTGNTGGAVGPDGTGNINVIGASGATFTGDPGTNTLTLTLPGGGETWMLESMDFTAAPGNGYLITSAGLVHVTMPSSPLVGDSFIVAQVGSGTFTIVQNAGDSIQIGTDLTTTGTGGSITSVDKGDNLRFVCWASGPGASWIVLQPVGNFTVV